jgi:hypothetical protein
VENVRHLNPRDPDSGGTGGGFERIPPQDLDAEQAVLGAMLLSRQAITDTTAVLRDPADYYRPAHETIHRTILELHGRGEPADPITVTAALDKAGQLQRAGGAPYLHALVNAVPTAANAEWYAQIVHDKARLRHLAESATRIANSAYAADGDVDDIMQAARKEFDGAATTTVHGPAHLADSILDWDAFFSTDFGSVELLPGRLLAPGQQITIIGDGKAGKSLLVLEWLWRVASGRPFLGDRAHDPIPALYVDAENGQEQIQERLFSYGAGPGRMGLLTYASFPPVRPLDTPGGGADLMAMVRASGARVVVLDTVSRFISGPENEADTWLALYRNTLLPLKREGIASVRLDHFGKDKDRGGRGSSAKTQDVDHVWELTAEGGGMLSLKRTHTRTGVGPGYFPIRREARQDGDNWVPGATRHVLVVFEERAARAALEPGTVEYLIHRLDLAGIPDDAGNPVTRRALVDLQIPAAKAKIEEAVRIRKNRTNRVPAQVPATFPDEGSPRESPADQEGTTNPQVKHSPGTPRDGTGTPLPPASPPPKVGEAGERPREAHTDTPPCTVCGNPMNPDWASRGYDAHIGCDPATGSHPGTP